MQVTFPFLKLSRYSPSIGEILKLFVLIRIAESERLKGFCHKSDKIFRNFNCLNDLKGLKLTFFQKIIMVKQVLAESGRFKCAKK